MTEKSPGIVIFEKIHGIYTRNRWRFKQEDCKSGKSLNHLKISFYENKEMPTTIKAVVKNIET